MQLSTGADFTTRNMFQGVWALVDRKCSVLTAYFTIFGVVIALMKDVPDFAGDLEVMKQLQSLLCYFLEEQKSFFPLFNS